MRRFKPVKLSYLTIALGLSIGVVDNRKLVALL